MENQQVLHQKNEQVKIVSVDDILKILDSLTRYIVYFYPGYITIYVYYFLKAKTLKEDKGIIAKSVVLSFLYKICIEKFRISSEILYHFTMVTVSIIIPYIVYLIQESDIAREILDFLNIPISFKENEIEALEGEESPWLVVYMKNEKFVYEGFLGERELEEGKKRFISLKKYRKYILDDEGNPRKPYIKNNMTDDDVVIIYYDDIEIIEKRNNIQGKEKQA